MIEKTCENCKNCLQYGQFATEVDGYIKLDVVTFYVCLLVKDAMLKVNIAEDFERRYYLNLPKEEDQSYEEWWEIHFNEGNQAHYGRCKKFEARMEDTEL